MLSLWTEYDLSTVHKTTTIYTPASRQIFTVQGYRRKASDQRYVVSWLWSTFSLHKKNGVDFQVWNVPPRLLPSICFNMNFLRRKSMLSGWYHEVNALARSKPFQESKPIAATLRIESHFWYKKITKLRGHWTWILHTADHGFWHLSKPYRLNRVSIWRTY